MNIRYLYVTLALSSALLGCDKVADPDDIPPSTPTGALRIMLDATPDTTDVPSLGVEEVWVRFEDVLVHREGEEWSTLGDDRRDIDLMTLRGGSRLHIGGADVREGPYDAVRIIIADAWIIVDGTQEELSLEHSLGWTGAADVFDFAVDFWIDENTSTAVRLKWDLDTELDGTDDVWTLTAGVTSDVELE